MKISTVVISGAASGIGASIACALLHDNISILCIDILPLQGSELEKKLEKMPLVKTVLFKYLQEDAGNETRMMEFFSSNNFEIIGLVNNAGLLGGDKTHGGRTISNLETMLKAHVYPAMVLTELCSKKMPPGSSIVNIGSIELIATAPEVVLYTVAKGALWGMTVSYAMTLAPKNIRVNTVSPGDVETLNNNKQYEKSNIAQAHIKHFRNRTPLGQRSLSTNEIANVVLFLLSEKSSGITGRDIVVDLGHTRTLLDPVWFEGENPADLYSK